MEADDFIPISALQHYLYCPRQCALIHLEQVWAENALTAEGQLLHRQADAPRATTRHALRTVTALPLMEPVLGVTGKADVVEFHRHADGERAFPVEYKRGRPKPHRADEVQLCAQALCLEHMLGAGVQDGALFYGQTRRRKEVLFDTALRELTHQTIHATHAMLKSGRTPQMTYEPRRCNACSLLDLCQPALSGRRVDTWLRQELAASAQDADA